MLTSASSANEIMVFTCEAMTPMHTSTQCDAMHEASLTISGVLVRAVFVIVIVIVFPRLLTDVFPHLGQVLPWWPTKGFAA